MAAYYNEFDPFAAAWLRELIKRNLIAPGEVDERSISDVTPMDLRGFTQCHFFAGIGIWSYSLRLAGWPDERPVWTGSCPCQPFSSAGKGLGFDDERHLWPDWFWLIMQCQPERIYGEQVANNDALPWLDLVSTDLESADYSVGAVDLCVAGFGAPHIRQRFYWVADSHFKRRQEHSLHLRSGTERQEVPLAVRGGIAIAGMGNATCERLPTQQFRSECTEGTLEPSGADVGRLAHTDSLGLAGGRKRKGGDQAHPANQPPIGEQRGLPIEARGSTNGFWSDAEWLPCKDGTFRPVEPNTFPLAHRAPARVGRPRGYGNAISPWVAKAFIEASEESLR